VQRERVPRPCSVITEKDRQHSPKSRNSIDMSQHGTRWGGRNSGQMGKGKGKESEEEKQGKVIDKGQSRRPSTSTSQSKIPIPSKQPGQSTRLQRSLSGSSSSKNQSAVPGIAQSSSTSLSQGAIPRISGQQIPENQGTVGV